MRILLQDAVGKGYYDGTAWSGAVEDARAFDSVVQAEKFCRERKVTQALIVVKYNDPTQDIRFPVGAQDALLVSKPPTTRIKSLA